MNIKCCLSDGVELVAEFVMVMEAVTFVFSSQAKSAVLSKFQFLYPEGVPMSAGHHESLLNYTKVKVRSILCLMFYWPMGVTKKVEL